MKVSIRDWVTRCLRKPSRRLMRRATYLSACLTVGMVTAWAPDASATTLRLEVTPAETLTQAYVSYYFRNSSGQSIFSLGTVLGGQTTVFHHDFPFSAPVEFDSSPPFTDWWHPAGFAIVGLHGTGDETGVALSFPDDSPIVEGETWDSLIQPINGKTEQSVIDGLNGVVGFSQASFANGLLETIKVPYGSQATIVNFSDAFFGGTAIANVPEPATWVLLVTAAGIVCLARRRAG